MEEQLSAEANNFLNGKINDLPSDAQEITTAEAEELETKAEVTNSDDEIVLPMSGLVVRMDNIAEATGHMLMTARKECGGNARTGVFVMAKIATFNGEKKTAFDILDMDMEDVVALEDFYIKKKKILAMTRKK